jgi:hypothetical protein
MESSSTCGSYGFAGLGEGAICPPGYLVRHMMDGTISWQFLLRLDCHMDGKAFLISHRKTLTVLVVQQPTGRVAAGIGHERWSRCPMEPVLGSRAIVAESAFRHNIDRARISQAFLAGVSLCRIQPTLKSHSRREDFAGTLSATSQVSAHKCAKERHDCTGRVPLRQTRLFWRDFVA